jgi:predicted small lipoprotein YifL
VIPAHLLKLVGLRKPVGVGLLVLLPLALAGCGRNGPLEAPPGATPEAASATTPAAVAANPPPPSPDAMSTAPPAAGPPPPPAKVVPVSPVYNSFFLDPLVK